MASRLEICNAACSLAGIDGISSFSEDSAIAAACRTHFLPLYQSMLSLAEWPWAIRRQTVTGKRAEEGSRFQYQYELPPEYYRFDPGAPDFSADWPIIMFENARHRGELWQTDLSISPMRKVGDLPPQAIRPRAICQADDQQIILLCSGIDGSTGSAWLSSYGAPEASTFITSLPSDLDLKAAETVGETIYVVHDSTLATLDLSTRPATVRDIGNLPEDVDVVDITEYGGRLWMLSKTKTDGFVSSISITAYGSSGYTSAPTVTISGGGGSGATATATASEGTVRDISVLYGGSGYTSVPTVTITGGGGSGATATAVVSGGAVTDITVDVGGRGYTSEPTVTISGGGGSGAAATAAVAPPVSIRLTDSGSGYTSVPTVTISGGGGSGATAEATVDYDMKIRELDLSDPSKADGTSITISNSREVTGIRVTAGGSGYTSAPTVTFTGGGGSGATATAVVTNGAVTGITLTASGSGYTSAPTVSFAGGGGNGATATARLGGVLSSAFASNNAQAISSIFLEEPLSQAIVPDTKARYLLMIVSGWFMRFYEIDGDNLVEKSGPTAALRASESGDIASIKALGQIRGISPYLSIPRPRTGYQTVRLIGMEPSSAAPLGPLPAEAEPRWEQEGHLVYSDFAGTGGEGGEPPKVVMRFVATVDVDHATGPFVPALEGILGAILARKWRRGEEIVRNLGADAAGHLQLAFAALRLPVDAGTYVHNSIANYAPRV